jgi:amino-acid N-acetyltransferase
MSAGDQSGQAAGSLRQATRDDQDRIRELIFQAWLNPLGLDWKRFLVAVDPQDTVIAAGQIKPHRDGSRELASIVVAPEWRGGGLGRALVRALQDRSEPPLWLTCRARLVPYYQPLGFERLDDPGQMPSYFRWAYRLMNAWRRIRGRPIRLAVMVWRG